MSVSNGASAGRRPWNGKTPFKKGAPRPAGAGRKRGTQNKVTTEVKAAIQLAFEAVGGMPAFIAWVKENRASFYNNIWIRLLPTKIDVEQQVTYRTLEEVEKAIAERPLPMRVLDSVIAELEEREAGANNKQQTNTPRLVAQEPPLKLIDAERAPLGKWPRAAGNGSGSGNGLDQDDGGPDACLAHPGGARGAT